VTVFPVALGFAYVTSRAKPATASSAVVMCAAVLWPDALRAANE
jgi:hypothetical protein